MSRGGSGNLEEALTGAAHHSCLLTRSMVCAAALWVSLLPPVSRTPYAGAPWLYRILQQGC